uniref:Uncharacterized protein n=1 Tax=Faecalibaculum rodentium TaxID=1702221 RepID=A0A140DUG1_9FIRM|nr:hypothetical protein AALO17_11540 [Faecalibaculum rodentium]
MGRNSRLLADRLDSRLTGVNPDEQELVYCVRLGAFLRYILIKYK